MNNDNKIFDSKIKEMLGNAEEPVPSSVWSNIESNLTPSKRKVLPIWWYSLSTAAIIALTLGFFALYNSKNINNLDNTLLVEAQEEAINIIEAPREQVATITEVNTSVSSKPVTVKKRPQTVTKEVTTSTKVTIDNIDKIETVSEDLKTVENVEDNLESVATTEEGNNINVSSNITKNIVDTFNDENINFVQTKKKPNVSIGLYGNIMGMGDKKVGLRPMRSQATQNELRSNIEETGKSKFGMPVTLGVGVKFGLSERWALGLGINYTIMNRQFAGTYTQVENGSITMKQSFPEIKNSQNYIGVNLNVYFSIVSRSWVDFYAYAGVGADKCLSNKFQMYAKTNRYTHKDDTGNMQASTRLGVGVEFLVGQKLGIYIDPSAAWYISNPKMPKSIRTQYPVFPALELGLRFRI